MVTCDGDDAEVKCGENNSTGPPTSPTLTETIHRHLFNLSLIISVTTHADFSSVKLKYLHPLHCNMCCCVFRPESGVISIKRAIYGRVDEDTCTDRPSVMTFCRSRISDIIVRRM